MQSRRMRMVPAGAAHPQVKEFLSAKRGRGERDVVAIEGTWLLERALAAGIDIDALFISPPLVRGHMAANLVDAHHLRGVPVYDVAPRVLARMVDRDGPDGVAALGRLGPASLADLNPDQGVVVIADRIDLPGNIGTLVRCADGAGAGGIILSDTQVRWNHPTALKASMGTWFSLPIAIERRADVVAWLDAHEVRVVAADPSGGEGYRGSVYGGRVAIVLGSEREGLDPAWRSRADVVVSIPMLGRADSLNVSLAGALLLYEALHQRARDR